MTFADLAAGDSVFLDANTFIYHFGPDPTLGPLAASFCSASRTRILSDLPPSMCWPRWFTS